MTSSRRLGALVGVMAALLVVMVIIHSFGTPGTAPGTTGSATGRGPQGKTSDAGVPDVRLELLQREEAAFQNPVRNPFRFERRQTPGVQASGPRRPRQVVEAPPQPVGPIPDPPPPPIPLRFIGFLQPKSGVGRIAVLSDGRGTVIDGKEGDVIEGRYRLLRVGNDSADLVYLDGRGKQTIRLSGQ
jgi:hypothetical protein